MRTRFAPSPTGALHFGAMRTALFAWLCARATGGTFILRIEDTDQGRYIPGSEAQILESLRWLGLQWDEGPEVGGPYEPYVQSLRRDTYHLYGDQLVERGGAYWCTCTPERLNEMRDAQRGASLPTRYDRRCLSRHAEVATERATGVPAVLRQRMPEGTTEWNDVVHGPIAFDNADIDDSVLLKSDGLPTYHFAVVVDDHLMDVTHVIRAAEWIPSTPKHLALYSAFEWTPPAFAHVPPVLAEDGKRKLGKRFGARNILEYRDMGYLPSAIINAMVLLGWSSGTEQEVFPTEELCTRFSLDRVHPAGAIFDPKRLDAMSGIHIRQLPLNKFAHLLEKWIPSVSPEQRQALAPLLHERIVRFDEVPALVAPLIGDAPWADDVAFPPKNVDAATAGFLLDACIAAVESGGLDNTTTLREQLTELLAERGVKARDGFRVFYIAMLGKPVGLPVFDAMAFVGPTTTIARLRTAKERLL